MTNNLTKYLIGTVATSIISFAMKRFLERLDSAFDPVACPYCNQEMAHQKHSVYFCYKCHIPINVTSHGTYPLS